MAEHLDAIGAILTALSPVATGILGLCLRRTNQRKLRKLEQLTHEVQPNGGKSMRDAVDRIEAKVNDLAAVVDVSRERIDQIEADRQKWILRLETERAARPWWKG